MDSVHVYIDFPEELNMLGGEKFIPFYDSNNWPSIDIV